MADVSFVGPSYHLETVKPDVQRLVNMMVVVNEAPSGKSAAYLDSVPGLTLFSDIPVPVVGSFSTRYFGYEPDLLPLDTPPLGDALAARNAFVADLTSYSIETFEGTTASTSNPTLTFGGDNSCTTTGVITVYDPSDARPSGRFNTTPSGSRFLATTGTAFDIGIPATFAFDTPIAAFGCYLSDLADFGSAIRIWVVTTDGRTRYMGTPVETYTSETSNSSLGFFGFIMTDGEVSSVTFVRDDCFGFAGPINTDQIGFDDIIIATAAQLNGVPDGFPTTWPASFGFETLWGLHFNALVDGQVNRFPNSGALGDEVYDATSNWVPYGQDSATNSTSAGTWVTDGDFDGKAYACIGERVSLAWPSMTGLGGSAFTYRAGFVVDFEFKRTGSRVGGGEVIYIPNVLTVNVTATNTLDLMVVTDTGEGPLEIPISGAITLPLNTKVHVRVQILAQVAIPLVSSPYFRCATWIAGVLDADLGEDGDGYEGTIGSGTAGTIYVGGLDGSNYCPGVIDEVSIGNTLRCVFDDFTPPTESLDEIYPPGMFPSPYPAD